MQGGIYRNTDVVITGASHIPPTPNDMYNQLRFFYSDLKKNAKIMDEIEIAAWTHAEFVRIHPVKGVNYVLEQHAVSAKSAAFGSVRRCHSFKARVCYGKS